MIDLSIITINYNGLTLTIDLLESIRRNLAGMDYECLVLDNGSDKNEAIPLQKAFPEYTVLRSDTNLGFAGGNNVCLKQAKGRYFYLINNDTLLTDKSVKNLIDYLDLHPAIGGCSPKIYFEHPAGWLQFAGFTAMSTLTLRNKSIGYLEPDKGQYDKPCPTHYLHGAAMMVNRAAYEKVGPLPEDYFLYYEETDWSEAFKRNGFELWYLPLTTIVHRESQTIGSGSPLKQYYMTRNRLLFAKCNRNKLDFMVFTLYYLLLACSKDLLMFLVKGKKQHARAIAKGLIDFYKKRYGAQSVH